MADKEIKLGKNGYDWATFTAKSSLGAIPFVGTFLGELVTQIIPNQRLERIEQYLLFLDNELSATKEKFKIFQNNISIPQGIEILEDCLISAGRSSSDIRKQRLARLTFTSLTCSPINYREAKKMINLYSELTDEELIMLVYHREPSFIGSGRNPDDYHTIMMKKFPEVLEPISATLGQDPEVYRRKALQDSHRETLIQRGLCEEKNRSFSITPLGKILAEYIYLDDEYN